MNRRRAVTMPPAVRQTVVHGGNLSWAARRFDKDAADWLDLSTGISPFPYPFTAPPEACWTRLPDTSEEHDVRAAAASYYGAPGPACVVPAPGSQALIQLLPRLRRPGRVAVLGPTYDEHAACWRAGGHSVTCVTAFDALAEGHDVAVVGHPNNPDGRVLDRSRLVDLARDFRRRDGWLIVDEAFADLDPAVSVAPEVADGGLIVLRSFGKFFGLPGLRLGFAVTARGVAVRIAAALGPWAVSGPALAIATEAFADRVWIESNRSRLAARSERLDRCLLDYGLTVIGGTALFRLVADPDAHRLFEHLGFRAILARHFPQHPDRLRFGLPADEEGFARLEDVLATRPQT